MSNQIKSASSHCGCLLTRRGCSHGVFDFVKKPVLLEPPYIPFPASFSAAKTRSRTPPGRFPDISPTLVCVLVPSEVRLKAVWAVLDPRLGCFRTILVVFGVSGTIPGPTAPPSPEWISPCRMAARAHLCWCVYSDLRRHCMGCESQNAYLNVCSSTRTHLR